MFPEADRALGEACDGISERLGGIAPDLLVAFFTAHHEDGWLSLAEHLRRRFPSALLFGCTAQSVIGGGREVEGSPGISLTAATLPGVELHPFHVAGAALPELPIARDSDFLLLSDPFTAEVEELLANLDAAYPGRAKIGGVASAGAQPGRNLLFLGGGEVRSGTIGLALSGNLGVDAIVAQGCRPVGAPLFVTGVDDGVITEIDGRSPMDLLQDLYQSASPEDEALFRHSLFLGIEMSAGAAEYGAGDFLIRNLIGADPDSGALHVAAPIRREQVVQFHVRDGEAASQDLDRRLERYAEPGAQPRGALLFSCLGRGEALYGEPDHDSSRLRDHIGAVPTGGFFGNGEIGPVQGTTYLHGYTSAFALFRSLSA